MRIWIDLTNSPHVNFFSDLIRELQEQHEIILTCRPLANTLELLELHGFKYAIVGKHYGKSPAKKILGFMIRIWQLYRYLKNMGIHVGISHSSFYSPLVARLMGVPSIYLNDNEHAEGNRLAFLFADRIMIPEFLDGRKLRRQWASKNKIINYQGVKEGIYLCNLPYRTPAPISPEKKITIFIRPEPWTAQYYNGRHNFMDDLLMDLKDRHRLILLPRGEDQKSYYGSNKFSGITIPEKPLQLADIIATCNLFIGAGGTMTREAAVLGIPTISTYQDQLLAVDHYLISRGLMVHNKNMDTRFVLDFVERISTRPPDTQLLQRGRQAREKIRRFILEMASQERS